MNAVPAVGRSPGLLGRRLYENKVHRRSSDLHHAAARPAPYAPFVLPSPDHLIPAGTGRIAGGWTSQCRSSRFSWSSLLAEP